jgi:hypothetical protein
LLLPTACAVAAPSGRHRSQKRLAFPTGHACSVSKMTPQADKLNIIQGTDVLPCNLFCSSS